MGTTWRQHGDNMRTMWIIQFCLKICDLLRHPHLWVAVWVVGCISGLMDGSMGGQWVAPGQIIKNQINLDLIEIIQFCLKIYDLLTHPHLFVGVWVVGWMGGLICGSMGGVK